MPVLSVEGKSVSSNATFYFFQRSLSFLPEPSIKYSKNTKARLSDICVCNLFNESKFFMFTYKLFFSLKQFKAGKFQGQ
jgi:hypothetical protein